MKIVTKQKIKNEAQRLSIEGKDWHFHILTPECVFNSKKNLALILENTPDNTQFANYSNSKQESTAKWLLEFVHGIKANGVQSFTPSKSVSPNVK